MTIISGQPTQFDQDYGQLSTNLDCEYGLIWVKMKPEPIPCFNLNLLSYLRENAKNIQNSGGVFSVDENVKSVDYLVVASKVPGVFNLGGDLLLFRQLIKSNKRDALFQYAKACVDVLYFNIISYNLPLTTISLVQGSALGGGFEAALSSNIIIAEKSSTFGLPEVSFNLFPGMGAYSLLSQRLGTKRAEEMILSGQIYSATELHDIGLVDVLVDDGGGEAAVYDYIKKQNRWNNTMKAVAQIRQRCNKITYEELIDITKIWVDAALRLEHKDLRRMDWLIRAQQKSLNNLI